MCLLRSRVRLPSSAERRIGRERLGRKRRWRNLRISLTSGKRESRGEALTAVRLSHRVSAGPMAARTRCLTGDTRGRIQFLR